jgi:hypothetical protein
VVVGPMRIFFHAAVVTKAKSQREKSICNRPFFLRARINNMRTLFIFNLLAVFSIALSAHGQALNSQPSQIQKTHELVYVHSAQGQLFFSACQNNASSCRLLGGRGFSASEISAYADQLLLEATGKSALLVAPVIVTGLVGFYGGFAATMYGVFWPMKKLVPQVFMRYFFDNPITMGLPALIGGATGSLGSGFWVASKLNPIPRFVSSGAVRSSLNLAENKGARIEFDFSLQSLERDLNELGARSGQIESLQTLDSGPIL